MSSVGGVGSGGSGYYGVAAGKAAASANDINTDKKFNEMLSGGRTSGGSGAAQPPPNIPAGGYPAGEYKDYWTWMGRQIRGEAAKEAMGTMKVTPQQLAALPISQRADLERKIMTAVEERMRGLIDSQGGPQGGGAATPPGTGQTPGGQASGRQTSGGQRKGGWLAGGWIPGLAPPTQFPLKPGSGQHTGISAGGAAAGGKTTGGKQTAGTTPTKQTGGSQKSGGRKSDGQKPGGGTTGRATTGTTPHNGGWTGGGSRISHGTMSTLLAGQEVSH